MGTLSFYQILESALKMEDGFFGKMIIPRKEFERLHVNVLFWANQSERKGKRLSIMHPRMVRLFARSDSEFSLCVILICEKSIS